jgi:hypothetical protein
MAMLALDKDVVMQGPAFGSDFSCLDEAGSEQHEPLRRHASQYVLNRTIAHFVAKVESP